MEDEKKQYLDKDGLETVLDAVYKHLHENFPTKTEVEDDDYEWDEI